MVFGYTNATLSGVVPGNEGVADLIQAIGGFLTGTLGWTETEDRTDQAGSNHKLILQSNGEDNDASTFYLVLTSGSNVVGFQGATFWDTGTHTVGSGVESPSAATTVTLNAGSDKIIHYWLSGDKDSVNFITRVNGDYDGIHYGLIEPFTSSANDPFPVYLVGTSAVTVDVTVDTTNGAHSFLDGTTALTANEADWEAVFPNPVGTDQAPGNIFGATENFVGFPVIAGVSDASPTRRAVRGFSKNLWVTIGPSNSSLTQEDIFDPGTGKTYQVFFDGANSTEAVVIRRT